MKTKISILCILFFSVMFFACDNTKTEDSSSDNNNENEEVVVQNETFDEFYENFVTDEEFQMKRIDFPIRGGDHSEEGTIEWTKENWYPISHIDEIDTNEFDVNITKSDTKVVHEVVLPNSGFGGNISYELVDGKWFLTEHNIYNF